MGNSHFAEAQVNEYYIQKYEWTKRFSLSDCGLTSPKASLYKTNNRLYQFIPFSGDSAEFDTLHVGSERTNNLLIAVCDLNGILKNNILIKGASSIDPLFTNDGSFYMSLDGSNDLYVGENRIYNSFSETGKSFHIVRCNLNGRLFSLDTFRVKSSISFGGYNNNDGSFFIMFGDVSWYDPIYNRDSIFQNGKTTLIKLSESGEILSKWLFDGIFSNFSIRESQLNLYGKTKKDQTSYTVANKIYYRNNIYDQNNEDIAIGSFDLENKRFIWHDIIKTNGGLIAACANEHSFFVAIGYSDTLSFRGHKIIADSNIHDAKTILFSFNNEGNIQWFKNAVNGNATLSNMKIFEHSINFIAYTHSTLSGQFSWNHQNLSTSTFFFGSHRLVLDENGNKVRFYPIPKGYPSTIFFSENNLRYYINYFLKDTVTLDSKKYESKYKKWNHKEYLFTSVYAYDTTESFQMNFPVSNKITIYPNPTSNTFKFKGVSANLKTIGEVSIYDLNGDVVLNKSQSISDEVDISSLQHGIYMVSLQISKRIYYSKVIKQ